MIHQICCRLHKFRWQHLHTSTYPHNPNWTQMQSRPSREPSRPCKMIIKIIITVRVTSKTVPVNRKYTKHLKSFDILNVIQNNAYHSICKRVNPVLYRLSIKIDFFCWSDWPPPENKKTLSLPECLLCMCVYVCVCALVCVRCMEFGWAYGSCNTQVLVIVYRVIIKTTLQCLNLILIPNNGILWRLHFICNYTSTFFSLRFGRFGHFPFFYGRFFLSSFRSLWSCRQRHRCTQKKNLLQWKIFSQCLLFSINDLSS